MKGLKFHEHLMVMKIHQILFFYYLNKEIYCVLTLRCCWDQILCVLGIVSGPFDQEEEE